MILWCIIIAALVILDQVTKILVAGNMIDRVFLGYVVDFIEAVFIDFPVFNVADICVTVGAFLMAIYLIFLDKTFFVDKPKNESNGEADHGTDAKNDTH